MAVSSLKAGWSKLSARIRDYIDVVDSHYRAGEDTVDGSSPNGIVVSGDHLRHHHHHHHLRHCDKHKPPKHLTVTVTATVDNPRIGSSNKSSAATPSHQHHSSQHHHQHQNQRNHHHYHHYHHHNARDLPQQAHLQHQDSNCMPYDRRAMTAATIGRGVISSSRPAQSLSPNSTTISSSSRLTSLGYTKRKTAQGQVYFVDMNGNKYWHDPSVPKELLNANLDLDLLVGPLASNWEISQTDSGRVYYINHTKETTQFTDPRLVAYKDVLIGHLRATTMNSSGTQVNIEPSSEPCIKNNLEANKKELQDKISILRQELLKQQVLTHPCRIDIHRKRIFEESFRAVTQMQPRDLKKRLLIKFRGEEGLDYGGVAREWFHLLSREILNPAHGLFQYTSNDDYNLQINPDSGIVYREHLSYMNFCGRIMGMAIFHGHFIEGRLSLPLYKMLLRKPITLSDIESVDPDLHRSLNWILDNDITDVIDTTFLVHHNAFGQLQEHELKPNGRNITVTEANKHEYVSLYVNYRCRRGIEGQFAAIQRGFHELIHPSLLENFDEHELELLIGGLTKLNIDDWRLNTKLKNCNATTDLVTWFWDVVKSYDEDKRARLLQFVTGSPRVPIQGFKALQGVNSELRPFTIHMIRNGDTDNLPKSHTCFNRIDLPPYESKEKLRDKLTQAIEETIGFAMQ